MSQPQRQTQSELHKDFLMRFLTWRDLYQKGVKMPFFGGDLVWRNMCKYAALIDLFTRLNRSAEETKKRDEEQENGENEKGKSWV